MTSRVEVITSVERRRRWSREEKARLVAASFEPGVTASEVARSAGIHVSQLFRWRKDQCERIDANGPQLVPVEITPAPVPDRGRWKGRHRRQRRRGGAGATGSSRSSSAAAGVSGWIVMLRRRRFARFWMLW